MYIGGILTVSPDAGNGGNVGAPLGGRVGGPRLLGDERRWLRVTPLRSVERCFELRFQLVVWRV